jgi:hypothetical protein
MTQVQITPGNVEALLDARALEWKVSDDYWGWINRNGKTKRWKRNARRFQIPIRHGSRGWGHGTFAHITNENIASGQWRVCSFSMERAKEIDLRIRAEALAREFAGVES